MTSKPIDDVTSAVDSQLIEDLREALGYTSFSTAAGNVSQSDSFEISKEWGGSSEGLQTVGEFELLGEIGRGGMGIVYRARQPSLNRNVAVKIVHANLAAGGSRLSRFRTETRAIARLNHPNIIPIFAQGEQNSAFYFAMGLVEGCSLAAAIRYHPHLLSSTGLTRSGIQDQVSATTSNTDAVPTGSRFVDADDEDDGQESFVGRTPEDYRYLARMLGDVADGLAHAHDHDVIHRDIKPQNLLLSADGRMYITDFGLARLLDEPALTMSGQVMGTPAYLSPEQVRGDEAGIDHRTDIYSLGVTLYELLTGRRPFPGQTRQQIANSICEAEPVAPRMLDRRIPRELETICLRAMVKDPARRYASAHELAAELHRFAAGKPILTKPPAWGSRAISGMRRHRGIVGTGVVIALGLLVAGAFAFQAAAVKRDRAKSILNEAYDELVYFDYRAPQQVAVRVEEAGKLGAPPDQLNLVTALLHLGFGRNEDAIRLLRKVPADSPDVVRAQYMLAWALWRLGERAESRVVFDLVAAAGPPQSADEWFFRGLAAHFDRPVLAIEAYQQANTLRAATRHFFPQAVLHLARAYNQEMYATRSDAGFEHAQAILMQLIRQGHYKAYPYYLLSICQRLGGDIRQTRYGEDDAGAQERFQAALDWARLGQEVDPEDDRPISAEAECLERLGLYDEAIEARGRALAASEGKNTHCENLHYRWRLYFWRDNIEAAHQDIVAQLRCAPQSLFYAHVYPSWIAADAGDLELALREARAIASESPDHAQALLWSVSCQRILGREEEADLLLRQRTAVVRFDADLVPPQTPEWIETLLGLAAGERSLAEVIRFADQFEQPRMLKAEAYFHAAALALGHGDREAAIDRLKEAVQCFDSEQRYTYHARTLLEKLRLNPDWP